MWRARQLTGQDTKSCPITRFLWFSAPIQSCSEASKKLRPHQKHLPWPGLVLIHKWSKCRQQADSASLLPIPSIPRLALDPVRAYQDMLAAVPTCSPNDPLLMLPGPDQPGSSRTIVTIGHLRICLRQLLQVVGADPALYSLHSLRRGGASTSYHHGAGALDVQRHGGWRSNAFMDYITDSRPDSSRVAKVLTSALS